MAMLTPAEEQGLSGQSIDSRLRRVFYAMPPARVAELIARTDAEARRRKVFYLHEGRPETVRIFLRPLGVLPDQLAYLHYVSLTILNALKRLPDLYIQDFAIREIFPLSAAEQQWLWDNWGPSHRENNPVLGRLDAVVEFTSPMWKDSLKFLEPNLCGVGGIHLAPTCDQILGDVVLPVIHELDPSLELELGRDLRELVMQDVADHLDAIGRRGRNLCFVEPKYAGEGPEEQEALAEYFHARHGLRVMHADPSELYLRGDEVYYEDNPVDIAYRDYEVRGLLEIERDEGVDLAPIKKLFRENRIISSLVGEFDHKSCWELLTDPQFTNKYFTADERLVFRRHILWTRIVADRQTTLPDGDYGDLMKFATEERDILVLKPNRAYGGSGVMIGHSSEPADWDAALARALTEPGEWVVQRQAILPVNEFTVLDGDGRAHLEPFHTVMGFAPTRYGLAIVGRASQKQVVNVAQRGGMCSIMLARSAAGLTVPVPAATSG